MVESTHLRLFGQPVVWRGCATPSLVAPSLQPLLAFLSLERNLSCDRERLVDSLWPDVRGDRARHRLNTAVWRCRKLLRCDDAIVVGRGGHVSIDERSIEIDLVPVARALGDDNRASAARGDRAAQRQLCDAVAIDASQFLAGNYHEWVVQARHRIELSVIKGVETLLHIADDPTTSIEWAELLVRLDPLREDAHRRLIRLYAEAGRRADALRQFDECTRHLHDDLGVEPLVETALAAAAVREGVTPMQLDLSDPRRILGELRAALQTCQEAVEHIESVLVSRSID